MVFLYLSIILSITTIIGAFPNRIANGHNTTIEKYPHQIIIEEEGIFQCGGSIISAHYVLTAAHCVEDEGVEYIVKSGTANCNSGGEIHEVSKIISHENYEHDDYGAPRYDIALIKVKKPFKFDETRQPIKLFNREEEAKPYTAAIITGWGHTRVDSVKIPEILKEASLSIIDKNVCAEALAGEFEAPFHGEICAGLLGVGGQNTCKGDSGGPLTIGGKLAGITSWGLNECENPKTPGVYTEVAYFRDWIDKHTKIKN